MNIVRLWPSVIWYMRLSSLLESLYSYNATDHQLVLSTAIKTRMPVSQPIYNCIQVLILYQDQFKGRLNGEDCEERITMHRVKSSKSKPFVNGHICQAQMTRDPYMVKTGSLSVEQSIPLTQGNSWAKLQTMWAERVNYGPQLIGEVNNRFIKICSHRATPLWITLR